MKFSNFFIPTSKEFPTDSEILSQKLMFRAGMMKKVSAGLFMYLPLFNRMIRKVSDVIRGELEKIGCLELKFPILTSKDDLDATNRWNAFGEEMFRVTDRHGNEYAISPTNEEAACVAAKNYVRSYKDLPFSIYQIQQKHRDEIRPKNGIMRAREFIMKDAYSFHANAKDLDDYYEKMRVAYFNIFNGLGIDVVAVNADTDRKSVV